MDEYRKMLDTIIGAPAAPGPPPDDLLKCCQLVLEFADEFLATGPENVAALYGRLFSQQTRTPTPQQQRREIKKRLRSEIKKALAGRVFRLFGAGNTMVGFEKSVVKSGNAAVLKRVLTDPLHFQIEVDDTSGNLFLVTTEASNKPQYVYGSEDQFYLSEKKQPRAYLRYSTRKTTQRQSTQTRGGRLVPIPSGNAEGFLIVFERDGTRYYMEDSSFSEELSALPLTNLENPSERSLWKVWPGESYPPRQVVRRAQQAKHQQQAQVEEQDRQRTYQELLRIPRRRRRSA